MRAKMDRLMVVRVVKEAKEEAVREEGKETEEAIRVMVETAAMIMIFQAVDQPLKVIVEVKVMTAFSLMISSLIVTKTIQETESSTTTLAQAPWTVSKLALMTFSISNQAICCTKTRITQH